MATIIDFQSRRIVQDEPSIELETDWELDTIPHKTAGRMVYVKMLVREDYAGVIEAGFKKAWASMVRGGLKTA